MGKEGPQTSDTDQAGQDAKPDREPTFTSHCSGDQRTREPAWFIWARAATSLSTAFIFHHRLCLQETLHTESPVPGMLFLVPLRLASVTAAGNLPCSTPPAEAPPSKFSASSSLNPFLILFLARCGGAHLPSWHLGVQGQSLGSL